MRSYSVKCSPISRHTRTKRGAMPRYNPKKPCVRRICVRQSKEEV